MYGLTLGRKLTLHAWRFQQKAKQYRIVRAEGGGGAGEPRGRRERGRGGAGRAAARRGAGDGVARRAVRVPAPAPRARRQAVRRRAPAARHAARRPLVMPGPARPGAANTRLSRPELDLDLAGARR